MNGELFVEFLAGTYYFVLVSLGTGVGLCVLAIAMRIGRPDPAAQLAKAIGLGHVGEHLGEEDELEDVRENPASADSMPEIGPMQPRLRRHLPRRQAIQWLDGNTVYATTRYHKPFYGEIVGRKRGELILQREKGCPIHVRQPQ